MGVAGVFIRPRLSSVAMPPPSFLGSLSSMAQMFAPEPAGIGLDEIAAKFAVGRRTFDILARATISPRFLPHTS
jgi:hypothetical protein